MTRGLLGELAHVSFLLLISMITGAFVGVSISGCHHRNEAIKAGAGQWKVDAATGRTYFVYGKEGDK